VHELRSLAKSRQDDFRDMSCDCLQDIKNAYLGGCIMCCVVGFWVFSPPNETRMIVGIALHVNNKI